MKKVSIDEIRMVMCGQIDRHFSAADAAARIWKAMDTEDAGKISWARVKADDLWSTKADYASDESIRDMAVSEMRAQSDKGMSIFCTLQLLDGDAREATDCIFEMSKKEQSELYDRARAYQEAHKIDCHFHAVYLLAIEDYERGSVSE
jgi:hypothetical protein